MTIHGESRGRCSRPTVRAVARVRITSVPASSTMASPTSAASAGIGKPSAGSGERAWPVGDGPADRATPALTDMLIR